MKSLLNWRVLLNFLLAIVVFLGLVWLTFRWLEIYTNHGKEVSVPNVMNQTVHEAIKILDEAGLDYEVDSAKYDPKYKSFQVLGVFPRPGAKVKDGRTVTLRVNPRTWAKVTIPDILDKYKGLAFRRLNQVGLKVGDTIYEPNIQRDAIIRLMYNGNEIKPGEQLPRFSSIDLVIGTGPKRNIPVPNLVGLTVAEAKMIVQQNLFELGLVEFDDKNSDERAYVYYQDPAPGSLRDQGMQVDIWASKKPISQMQEKINHLNSIYRIKIDTTLPPVRYEEIPAFEEPVFDPPSSESKKQVEATKVETKTSQKSDTKNSGISGTKTLTPQNKQRTEPSKTTSETPKNTEKPKAKVVID